MSVEDDYPIMSALIARIHPGNRTKFDAEIHKALVEIDLMRIALDGYERQRKEVE